MVARTPRPQFLDCRCSCTSGVGSPWASIYGGPPGVVDCGMPTVLRVAGCRFFFFSNERQEPAHIHVERAEAYAKFWLAPVRLAGSHGFRSGDLAELGRLVVEHAALFQERWDEFFSR